MVAQQYSIAMCSVVNIHLLDRFLSQEKLYIIDMIQWPFPKKHLRMLYSPENLRDPEIMILFREMKCKLSSKGMAKTWFFFPLLYFS